MKKAFFSILFVLTTSCFFGQAPSYAVLKIADSLKQNANAVVRLSETNIVISAQDLMVIKSKTAITVLNEYGLRNLDLMEYYNKNTKINKIEATAYDSSGGLLKVYKKKDFRDFSVADGFSVFSDNRAIALDYTPVSYPFTIVLDTEIETSNTAFIPGWSPVDDYLVSTEKSLMTISYMPELKLRKKEVNFSGFYPIVKNETTNSLNYNVVNLLAKKREELSPDFTQLFPVVYFSLENFVLENVKGSAVNWSEFGKWYYNSLLADTEEIPEETKIKIMQLIGNESNPIEIAKIVYKYVQEKTRYVSIQVGIGGWKPMLAKDVDKLGYGDCKALSNYTRSLLKAVGVESYCAVVFAGADNIKELHEDFASIQGNHMILAIPNNKELIWLECTSQVHPFGFQGDFTDDRNVLLIKPDGGQIVKTKTFTEIENLKRVKGSYQVFADGNLKGNVQIVSNGLNYDNEFSKERMSREDQVKKYKEEFRNINNLSVKKIVYTNDNKKIEFVENLEVEAERYAQDSGGKLMFALNAFDQSYNVPKKYKSRECSFKIERGYSYEDEIETLLPEGFVVEAKPEGLEVNNEFGNYKIEFISVANNKVLCKRKLILKKGTYESNKYEIYRKFRETIARNDNSKIIISKA